MDKGDEMKKVILHILRRSEGASSERIEVVGRKPGVVIVVF